MNNRPPSTVHRPPSTLFSLLWFLALLLPSFAAAQISTLCNRWSIEVSATPLSIGDLPLGCEPTASCGYLYYYVYLKRNSGTGDFIFASFNVQGSLRGFVPTPFPGRIGLGSNFDNKVSTNCSPSYLMDDGGTFSADGKNFVYNVTPGVNTAWPVNERRLLFVLAVNTHLDEVIELDDLEAFAGFPGETGMIPCYLTVNGVGSLVQTPPTQPSCTQNPQIDIRLGAIIDDPQPQYPNRKLVPVYLWSTQTQTVSLSELELRLNLTSPSSVVDYTYADLAPGVSQPEKRVFTGTFHELYVSGKNVQLTAANTASAADKLFYFVFNGPALASICQETTVKLESGQIAIDDACCKLDLQGTNQRKLDWGAPPCVNAQCSTITFEAGYASAPSSVPGENCPEVSFPLYIKGNPQGIKVTNVKVVLDVFYSTENSSSLDFDDANSDGNSMLFPCSGGCLSADNVAPGVVRVTYDNTFDPVNTNLPNGNMAPVQIAKFAFQGADMCIQAIVFQDAVITQSDGSRCVPSVTSNVKKENASTHVCLRKLAATFKMAYGSAGAAAPTLADEVQLGINSTTTPTVNCVQALVTGGSYSKCPSCPNGNYEAVPSKTDNPLNGVTTLDLALISKHILGISYFTSNYQMIAADASKNNRVTTFDVVELRKLILGTYDELPNNTSFRFIPQSYNLPAPLPPDVPGFPENIPLSLPSSSQLQLDFYGIKIGDVNGDVWVGRSTQVEEPLGFALPPARSGEEITVPIFALQGGDWAAWQTALHYDTTALRLVGLQWADEKSQTGGRDWHEPKRGELRVVWYEAATPPSLAPGNPLFRAVFRAKKDIAGGMAAAQQLIWPSDAIPNVAYLPSKEAFSLSLAPSDVAVEERAVPAAKPDVPTRASELLLEIYPNPTPGVFRLDLWSPADTKGTLQIRDLLGRSCYQGVLDLPKGTASFTSLVLPSLPPGQYLVRVDTPQGGATKRLVVQ